MQGRQKAWVQGRIASGFRSMQITQASGPPPSPGLPASAELGILGHPHPILNPSRAGRGEADFCMMMEASMRGLAEEAGLSAGSSDRRLPRVAWSRRNSHSVITFRDSTFPVPLFICQRTHFGTRLGTGEATLTAQMRTVAFQAQLSCVPFFMAKMTYFPFPSSSSRHLNPRWIQPGGDGRKGSEG